MFIKEKDFAYLEGLYKGLDEGRKKRFLKILLKAGSRRSGEEGIKKIEVVGDEIFDVLAVEQDSFITRTIIKKAFKEAKGE
ncbi:MAG: hypothetical protein M0Z75_03450 [Nitrospiraceae bacterium]|nr:hypothetical protein [Nitrospiraceae bacterium]MDA8090119.1 hypothetical protein [Nitrospiraceae bacterium]